MNIHEINEQFVEIIKFLEHRADELKLQERLKDIDARRADLERRTALFVPQKRRLERGGKALELTESFRAIRELRQRLDASKIREDSLRRDITEARTKLQNADEAVNIMEGEYREKLQEQGKLDSLAQKVKMLDEQAQDRQDSAVQVHVEFEEARQRLKEFTERTETEQKEAEKLEVALREARKFLQLHAIDEKLASGLPGIKKYFAMYEQAEAKQAELRRELNEAIVKRQEAQSTLNDRAAMFSEVSNRYSVIEKQHAKAKAFFDTSLKGKTIDEWKRICDLNIKRLSSLDEVYAKFQELAALEGQLRNLQDTKLKLQQETRNLSIKESEQQSSINSLNDEISELSKILQLLDRIGDLEAVRELLSGSVSAKYSSVLPNPEVIRQDLAAKQALSHQYSDSLTATRSELKGITDRISDIEHNESQTNTSINTLNAELAQYISSLGLKFTPGIPPLEELDRERHRTRDALQLARNSADTAESAKRDLDSAEDEFTKITQKRSQVSRFHQEALFTLRTLTSQEEHCNSECKVNNEALARLKRELLALINPYGWKAIPDTNPEQVIESLSKRLTDWQEGVSLCDRLEHELTAAQAKMSSLKKERETLRVKNSELSSRVKALEAERDSIRQQRIILFASRVPEEEQARMAEDVKNLRTQLDSRIESKAARNSELNEILSTVHTLETEMAVGREELHKQEISFSKRLLELGFRNEDDYASAVLTSDERRDLQGKLRELTQTDFDLNSERENTRAKILELQADKESLNKEELLTRIKALKSEVDELRRSAINDPDEASERQRLAEGLIPAVKQLMLSCGLEEIF